MTDDKKNVTKVTVGEGTFEPSPQQIDEIVDAFVDGETPPVATFPSGLEPQSFRDVPPPPVARLPLTDDHAKVREIRGDASTPPEMPKGDPLPPPDPDRERGKAMQAWQTRLVRDAHMLRPEPKVQDYLLDTLAGIDIPDMLTINEAAIFEDKLSSLQRYLISSISVDWARDKHAEMEKEQAESFLHRYRQRRGKTPEQLAEAAEQQRLVFMEFFDLAAKLNESAHALAIKTATLNADTGEVTVVFRTRPLDEEKAKAAAA